MAYRVERINSLIQEQLSDILRNEVKDPRLSVMLSITRVETAPDLKYTRVFVSSLGGIAEKEEVLKGLGRAGGFLRSSLTKRLDLRVAPELDFRWDESIEHGAHILELLDRVKPKDEKK